MIEKYGWGSWGWLCVLALSACGEDGTEADRIGVGGACVTDADCPPAYEGDEEVTLKCLTDFKGGYCGLTGCNTVEDCPDGSACVTHDDGENYCFRTCTDKPECNQNRSADVESNCSSNIEFPDMSKGQKACVPPSD